ETFATGKGQDFTAQDRSRRTQGSKHDSNEEPPCLFFWCTLNMTSWGKRPNAGVVRKFGEEWSAQVHIRNLTVVKYYDVLNENKNKKYEKSRI
ncbi:hypothetical protein AVEN_126847-1, partial [Araneus ventricosus]